MKTKSISRTKRGRTKPRSRFQRLWEEAEQLASENETLNTKLESLVQRISTEVRDAERTLGDTVKLAVHRQLDFAEKKSLLKWQRSELSDWTEELLTMLMEMGQFDITLQNRLAQIRAHELGVELDENSETEPVEQLRAHLQEFYEYEEEDDDDDDQDYLDYEEELEELLKQLHEQFDEHAEEPPLTQEARKSKPAFDDTVFKRLFRQTAAALHPDKEADPERQREKHELMSALLRARKERDLITIVRLHEQHANAESDLSTADEQQLEEVLVDYLEQQNDRMEAIVHRSPMHEWVYREFYHDNPATVKRRIKAHISKIESQREGFDLFVTRVKTLKELKEILADRYEQNRYNDAWF